MTETHHDAPRMSRRSIAKGAAWAAPVLIASQGAVAYASSTDERTPKTPPTGKMCKLFFGSGTLSSQRMNIYLGFDTDAKVIPAGTVVTWKLTVNNKTGYYTKNDTTAPRMVYAGHENERGRVVRNDAWTLESSAEPETEIGTNEVVTYTWTANQNVTTKNVNCNIWLIWDNNDKSNIVPGATVSMGGISFKVPNRQAGGNERHPKPTKATEFLTPKQGGCFPPVKYSKERSSGSGCGDGKNNTSTIYPDGVCKIATGVDNTEAAQVYVPAYPDRCNKKK